MSMQHMKLSHVGITLALQPTVIPVTYNEQWKSLIDQEWGISPKPLPYPQKGIQYGDNKQSLYIIVYDVGTILVQGNMAIQYSMENMERLISSLRKPSDLKAAKRSKAFKEAYKLFGSKPFAQPKHKHPQTHALPDLNNTYSAIANFPEAKSVENLVAVPKQIGRIESEISSSRSQPNHTPSQLETAQTNPQATGSGSNCESTSKENLTAALKQNNLNIPSRSLKQHQPTLKQPVPNGRQLLLKASLQLRSKKHKWKLKKVRSSQ